MSNTPLALALRIALIIEENSERELQSAVRLLREQGSNSALLDFLSGERELPASASKDTHTRGRQIHETTSLAVRQLREVDQDKYRLLFEFDKMVRRGQVLATLDHLKRFGERISKDFQPRKSKKDTIGHLVATMAEKPITEIERLVEFAASFGVAGDTDEYQRLAQYLIKGHSQSDRGP